DFVAERIAKACLLTPIDGKDSLATAHLAEIAVTRGKDSEYFPSFAFAKALAEFRAGAFESAAEWAQRVLAKAGIDLRRDAQSYLVLAMAHQQLKQSLEARAALA